mmetsp:Transcript_18124/g.41280  ORF Transcript_18124/g.41280 Transcript_18124/m.41280 type:complete len:89 (+) Transcript_18124:1471-1737(+)
MTVAQKCWQHCNPEDSRQMMFCLSCTMVLTMSISLQTLWVMKKKLGLVFTHLIIELLPVNSSFSDSEIERCESYYGPARLHQMINIRM